MRPFLVLPRPVIDALPGVPDVATTQDGMFTRTQARLAGWSDDLQRALIREGTWRSLAGPVLHHAQTPIGPWQRARAVSLTAGLVASHHTAGALWGLEVSDALHGIGHVARRTSPITRHRVRLALHERVDVAGLVLTSPMRTLTDLLCSLEEEAAATMSTAALRDGILDPSDLAAAARLARGRTGAARARAMAESCLRAPHSYLEWRFHGLMGAEGPGWRFNADIRDEAGFVGRVDAVHTETMTVIEIDGERFHGPDRFQADRTRDQRLIALGYVVLRFTWDDIVHRPLEVLARIRATVRHRAQGGRTAA